jgi:hypothetical protein
VSARAFIVNSAHVTSSIDADMSRSLTPSSLSFHLALDSHFDTDGSGYIEKRELAGLAKELGYALSREELKVRAVWYLCCSVDGERELLLSLTLLLPSLTPP